jgi:XTP/dITP diphosphohydrolase
MKPLFFSTGNDEKFIIAEQVCRDYGVELIQKELAINEIQAENSQLIVNDKVKKAYELLQSSVVVSDDSWEIPGLNGFPGPYMKSINQWLRTEDFLRLTDSLNDRRIYLTQRLAYKDSERLQTFSAKIEGVILKEPKGNYGKAIHKIVALHADGGLTMAEYYDNSTANHSQRDTGKVWHTFAAWYRQKPQP